VTSSSSGSRNAGTKTGGKTSSARRVAARLLLRYRAGAQMAVDVAAWTVALFLAVLLRFDFSLSLVGITELPTSVAIAGAFQVVLGLVTGLYLGRRRYGSFEEVALLGAVVALVTAVVLAANLVYGMVLIPRSSAIAGGALAFGGMGAARYAWRLYLEARRRPQREDVQRLLVFGAGDGAVQVITAMLNDPGSPYLPVALLDDDRSKRYLSIKGVKVVGSRGQIAEAATRYRADALLVAVPSAGREVIGDLNARAEEAGLEVRVLPSIAELFGGDVALADIRPVTQADLLGRGQVDLDVASIAEYLTGKRVLVTGAGGSIGSELCRQIARFDPAELLLADRDESALHALQLTLHGRASLDDDEILLLDIRDRERVFEVLHDRRPQVVFHAAALKHVTALEAHPMEAVKTNVHGTLHLLEAAEAAGVDRFVNVSTDKAADPVNVLGYTKRIAERLTATIGSRAAGEYLSVRFGNVLGSRGSVLTVFRAQVEAGGPITVTDPDTTRYFMTVEEACQLVIQAGAVGSGGEALVLDMGEPVRIADVARRLANQVDPPVAVEFTGLRPGEKLHEVLLEPDEEDRRPRHPLISHVDVPQVEVAALGVLDTAADREQVLTRLRELGGHHAPV
jgi:FlaA1/EpsC-like NDP-sugar epimerase